MNRRIRKQSAAMKSENSYLRYLRPGALAQLRDSKISARSHLQSSDFQISLHRAIPSSPSRSPNAAGAIQQQQQEVTDGELPFLSARFSAPRFPQRKKLMAARSMCFLNRNPNSLTSDGPEPTATMFSPKHTVIIVGNTEQPFSEGTDEYALRAFEFESISLMKETRRICSCTMVF